MEEAYIVAAVRTPIGKMGGTLKSIMPHELATLVLKEVVKKVSLDPKEVDEVIMGWTRQTTDSANIARYSLLAAGYPVETRAYTTMQQCSSGMLPVQNAWNEIRLGYADVVVAGGIESLSTAPFYFRGARFGFPTGNNVVYDSVTEGQMQSQPNDIYGSFSMGMTAENLAEKYGITRQEQDEFAFQSQTRAKEAIEAGKFKDEIVPVIIPQRKADPIVFDTDESPRLSPVEVLAKLKPVFRMDEKGTVTAGNACGRSDGASALIIMSGKKCKELGIKPLAKIIGQGVAGVDPRYMGIGPVPATKKALSDAGLKLEDIDLVELNEAFAAQSLACIKELGLDQAKVNVNGGAIALGHPLGATGARIITTLVHEMSRREDVKYGLATLCVGGGMGSAVVLERV